MNQAHEAGGSLLVASQRLPFEFERGPDGRREPAPGGLASALDPALRKRGGTWVGWPGCGLAEDQVVSRPGDPYRLVPVPLGEATARRFDAGFCTGSLWPLFHSMPGRPSYQVADWDAYRAANQCFAEALLAEADAGDLLWVHDYQLMLVPERVRRERPRLRTLFFLHVPFPPPDVFCLMPYHEELLEGVLASDLVAFQIPSYVSNFLDCAERCLGASVDRDAATVEHAGRITPTGVFPIGIDARGFEAMARGAEPAECKAPGEQWIVGADRLDGTKGIPERIRVVERLLERWPEHLEHIALIQVAVPSRSPGPDYVALKGEIDEIVGRVNGRFATDRWSPIRYLVRRMDADRLAGLYRQADVAMVTPLRDGMSVVAKEFVACQVDEPGVLVLSKFAGAADGMKEALLVNPYDLEDGASALHRALVMPESERAARMAALREREARHDVHDWADGLLHAVGFSRG